MRSAGVKTWLYHWVKSLRATKALTITSVFEPPDHGLDLNGGLPLYPGRITALTVARRLPGGAMRPFIRKADVFHVSGVLGKIPRGPMISATVHDLTAWRVPGHHRRSQVQADLSFAERILRHADGLIAVSESTRNDALEILRIDPRKVCVIYPGVDPRYFNVSDADVESAKTALRLQRPWFLFAGTIEPRKNVDSLLDAWMLLPEGFRREIDLIIAGMPGWDFRITLNRLRQMTVDQTGVRYIGPVAEKHLPGLTAGALALVYPSYYEGFGFPVAQAMAARCPVITSNISSLPEITGQAALLADPGSPAEIAAAMTRLANSPALRESLSHEGRERAGMFSWQNAAEQSVRFFRNMTGH